MYGRGGGGKVRDRDRTASRTNEQTRTRNNEGTRKEPPSDNPANRYMGQWFSIIGSAGNSCVARIHPYLTTRSWDVIVFGAPCFVRNMKLRISDFFFFPLLFSVHGFSVQLRSKFFLSVINFLRKQLFSTVWYTFPFIKQNISLLFLTKSRVESTPFQHRFIFSPTISRYPSAI